MNKIEVVLLALTFTAGCYSAKVEDYSFSETYTTNVDYSLTIKYAIANGNYQIIDKRMYDGQLTEKKQEASCISVVLVRIPKYITIESAIKFLKGEGLRPGTDRELLAFGSQWPELQKKYAIVTVTNTFVIYTSEKRKLEDRNHIFQGRSISTTITGKSKRNYSIYLASELEKRLVGFGEFYDILSMDNIQSRIFCVRMK